jgi:probable HAF family extracellular repeat protein
MRGQDLLLILAIALRCAVNPRALAQPLYTAQQIDLGGDTASGSAESGLLVGTAALPGGEEHAFLYHNGAMTDLGTFGGIYSGATAIDDAGDVVGEAQLPDANYDAFIYSNGKMTDLGSFGQPNAYPIAINSVGSILINAYSRSTDIAHSGIYVAGNYTDVGSLGGDFTNASALNSSYTVVGGASLLPGSAAIEHAFSYTNGQLTDLTTLPGVLAGYSTDTSNAVGVSDAGLIAGNYFDNSDNERAFVSSGTDTQDIGTLGGASTIVTAVSPNGLVIGESDNSEKSLNAFLYSGATLTNLGTLGGATSRAVAVNAAGQVAGFSDTSTPGDSHGFLYSNGQIHDLGTLGGASSQANAINTSGEVAGTSTLTVSGQIVSHAFLYQNGTMTDIGSLGGRRITVRAINDQGDVVGTAMTPGGLNRAYAFINGAVVELPTLGGDFSDAVAGNSSGAVIGNSATLPGFSTTAQADHAFFYQDGQMLDLGNYFSLAVGATITQAIALNASGQAVGNLTRTVNGANEQDIFVYQRGHQPKVLTPPSGTTITAKSINAGGEILGTLTNSFFPFPFIYSTATGSSVVLNASGGGGTPVAINDAGDAIFNTGIGYSISELYRASDESALIIPGLPSYPYTDAFAINNRDQIVGAAFTPATGLEHAFLYSNGTTLDVGALFPYSSQAEDINANGDVLGRFEATNDPYANLTSPSWHAFLYTDGSAIDLNTLVTNLPPGWVLNDAAFYPGTNDILATGVYGSRTTEFLLSIPEPTSAPIAIASLTLPLLTRRRVKIPGSAGRSPSNL